MRQLQSNISTLGKTIVRQGNQLIVRVGVLRSLRANSLSALRDYASRLFAVLCDVVWQVSGITRVKPAACTARCFAQAMQHPRGHAMSCHRTAAPQRSA